MKHLTKIALMALIVASATSCNSGEEPDTKTIQSFTNCYAVVTDTQTGEVTVSEPVTIGLLVNFTQQTTETSFSGFKLGGQTYPILTLTDAQWTTNTLWAYTTTGAPNATLTTNQPTSVSGYSFTWSDRMDMPDLPFNSYDPALVYSMDIDGRYHLEGSRTPFNLWGTTTASSEGVADYTSPVTNIIVTPDFKASTVTILILKANFASGMPSLNIQLDDIPMKFVDGGKSFSFAAESLIPTMEGAPVPSFPVSNVSGTINPKTGMQLEFGVLFRGTPYTVKTTLTNFGYRE